MAPSTPSFDAGGLPPVSALVVAQRAADLRNVLAVMMRALEPLRTAHRGEMNVQAALAEMDAAIDSGFHVARDLLTMVWRGRAEPELVDVNAVVLQARSAIERSLPPGIRLTTTLRTGPSVVDGDAIQLEWVLLNLALNAADAMPDGGAVAIETKSIQALKGAPGYAAAERHVAISVSDTGTGLSPDAWNRAFDPFFSTREGRAGMGLTSVAMTIRRLRGWISVHENVPQGTRVTIFLPATSSPPAAV